MSGMLSKGGTIRAPDGRSRRIEVAARMTNPLSHEVTALLGDWSSGSQTAYDKLVPLVYEEPHRIAHHYMNGERAGHTLQTTALVGQA